VKGNQLTLRKARSSISQILASGQTATIARPYESVRGFIVGVPKHERWNAAAKKNALRAAKQSFLKAWQDAAAE
jgi:hypothetical protein